MEPLLHPCMVIKRFFHLLQPFPGQSIGVVRDSFQFWVFQVKPWLSPWWWKCLWDPKSITTVPEESPLQCYKNTFARVVFVITWESELQSCPLNFFMRLIIALLVFQCALQTKAWGTVIAHAGESRYWKLRWICLLNLLFGWGTTNQQLFFLPVLCILCFQDTCVYR